MKSRTLIAAGTYINLSTLVLGIGIAVAAAVIAVGNLIEGVMCCVASERQD